MHIRNIAWIQQVGSFVTTRQQVEAGLNLLPVPVEISWRLPVSHLEEPSILHVHQSDNLLVSIAGNKHSPHKVKSLLINTSSCGAEQRHHSKDLHLFILLCHFRQETVWSIFRFTHDTSSFHFIHLEIVNVPLTQCNNMRSNVDVTGRNFFGLNDVHVFQFLDEFVQFLNVLLVLVVHHS